jgi:Protein kinase domain
VPSTGSRADQAAPESAPASTPQSAQTTQEARLPGLATDPRSQREPAAGQDVEPSNDRARIGFIGKKLGRFLITAELGRGGMATVYRARDPNVGRDVAVKVMHGFFAGRADIEARFRREANAVAAIRHRSILALYDFSPPVGEEPGYIVSELIDGPGLRQLVEARGGRLLPEVSTLIAVRIAEALGAAHAAGIVHRDVKPDNVLIDRVGGSARVVLTDFGVAHVGGMDTMTATGAVLGSPAYMSPEQARGDDVGASSDIFSLGVLMYQLCTAHLPFSGKDPLTTISAILRGNYLRPGKIEARVGPALEQIIARCLHPDPAARFPDGAAVAAALRLTISAIDLGDEEAALGRYLADPDAFEQRLSPGIARAAMAAAEQARRHGQVPRALGEVGRALAYVPDHPPAREMLDRLSSRGRSRWIGMAALGAGMAVVAGFFIASRLPATVETGAAGIASAPLASRPVGPPLTASPSRVQSAAPIPQIRPSTPTEPARLAASDPAANHHPRGTLEAIRRSAARLSTARSPGAGAQVAAPVPMATTAETIEAPPKAPDSLLARPATTAPESSVRPEGLSKEPAVADRAAPAPATASVVLRASHGFCEPSLDAHPPSLRASYDNVIPGPHEIFCTLPQGGRKVHVAIYDLRPGTRASLIIVPGADGRPILGRPE